MKTIFSLAVISLSLLTASAQMSGPGTGINAAMLKLFGDTKAFSAKARAQMFDQNQKEVSSMPMSIALRDGKMRADIDMTDVKMGGMPAEAAAMIKPAGMDKMVTIVQPQQKVTLLLYPTLLSYAEIPTKEDDFSGKMETAEVGKETIDGQACRKMKLTATDASGKVQEAFVWQATGLKNFPIQMQMAQKANTLIVKFENPKLETPEASLFEAPAGYTKYPNMQAMMQAAMMKMFGAGGK